MTIKCKKCNTTITGDKKGTYIECKCKSVAIDETKYYTRIIGNRYNYIILDPIDKKEK